MILKYLHLSVLLCFLSHLCISQNDHPQKAPKYEELLFFSTENNFYLSGETILFSAFCFNKETFSPSKVSSVAYVVLLDENKKVIHKTKISLKNGRGGGEIFVKSNYLSGNYYLLAYTSLMRNQPENDYFYREVSIVNPFIPYKKHQAEDWVNQSYQQSHQNLEISLKSKSLKKRSKTSLTINPIAFDASLLIAIQRNDLLAKNKRDSKNEVNKYFESVSKKESTTYTYNHLPDIKDELVSGNLISYPDSLTFPLKLFLSFPGNKFKLFSTILKSAENNFYFNLPRQILGEYFIIESPSCSSCEFEIKDKYLEKYDFVSTRPLVLEAYQLEDINQRSIKSQIENVYYESKQDKREESIAPLFYGTPDFSYDLKAYKTFSTMEEVFKEVTPGISLRKAEANYEIRFFNQDGSLVKDPLTLMDGIPVSMDEIINTDPVNIARIDVINRQYHQGYNTYNGVVSFYTNDHSLMNESKNRFNHINVLGSDTKGEIIKNIKRLPEYSRILYWEPEVSLEAGLSKTIEFQTGDDKGTYSIILFGVNTEGEILYASTEFIVE